MQPSLAKASPVPAQPEEPPDAQLPRFEPAAPPPQDDAAFFKAFVSTGGDLIRVYGDFGEGGANRFPWFEMYIDVARDKPLRLAGMPFSNLPIDGGASIPWLREHHEWVELVAYETAHDEEKFHKHYFVPYIARGEGLVVRYREPILSILDGQRVIVNKRVAGWSDTPDPPCDPGDEGCHRCPAANAKIGKAWGSRARGIVVVDVSFSTYSDVCGAPIDMPHVVRLP